MTAGGRVAGFGGLTVFVLLRARAHRLLLAAALLTVLLTTTVLAALTAYSGAVGDAALRHALADPRTGAEAALIVHGDVPAGQRPAADAAVREGAARTFDGLPRTVRTLTRSGPYALPGSLRPATERSGDPDLTFFAALDPSQVRIDEGRMPAAAAAGSAVEVAVPVAAAERIGVGTGDRLTLTDRLGGPAVSVVVSGLYRPADTGSPYWRLDDLSGRGVARSGFTTYGPLLAPPGVLSGGRVSAGASGWVVTADYASLTTARADALGEAARAGTAWLRARPVLGGVTEATTGLPAVLDRLDRSLTVSRSTLLVIELQLVLLAAGALLLVARLLSVERAGELRLLRARGASRARLAAVSALEALLAAVPALICAPLLAGPLVRLLAGHGAAARIGLGPQPAAGGGAGVWLVAGAAALGCTLAVTLPALTLAPEAGGRSRTLPGRLRAGADVGLLVVAGVAYWQLDRQTSAAGTGDAEGAAAPGVDPLFVATPTLALLAGTVLALRLLPLVARLAERRAAGGRGLTAALAGWQLSRRPMRGAGPVLLLVLAVALGTMAIGQGASWSRSQDDQADFRTGAPIRVEASGTAGPGRTDLIAGVTGVQEVAPAARSEAPLSGDRSATVLALDTAHAADTMLMRPDLADRSPRALLSPMAPGRPSNGARVPADTARLALTATLAVPDTAPPSGSPGASSGGGAPSADVTVTVEDRWGTPYRVGAGSLAADGREHRLAADLSAGPLTLTGVDFTVARPGGPGERHRLTVRRVTATATDGTVRPVPLPESWTAGVQPSSPSAVPGADGAPPAPRLRGSDPLAVEYSTGRSDESQPTALTVRLRVAQPEPAVVTAVATDRFLDSVGARTGQRVTVPVGGHEIPVRIDRSVRELPGAGPPEAASARFGGALLVDLPAVNRYLQSRYGAAVEPTEWWLRPRPGKGAEAVAGLRASPDTAPAQVVVRDEVAERLRDDPFGAGPGAAFAAATLVAAALAAVGFTVSAAGSRRERAAEFAVLRALGASRRSLARTTAVEQGVLTGLALLTGAALGAVLTRALIPLTVLTPGATRPVPDVHVTLPPDRVALLLAGMAVVPLLVTAALALRRPHPAAAPDDPGGTGR
ncbi:FtsX-like permease family protein [Streptomyces sp. BK208]|uniref:ABC transporter permease n=1 Tax=Streptomyces sp. BK208 TaxID=2512150 RepID=UPI0010EF3B6E|nr:ABC transporter permease [Streptomyces sp. BK208]TDT40959.1 FtsX-like permease family protein [Streptomyces sp. BK208]